MVKFMCFLSLIRMGSLTSCTPSGVQSLRRSPRSCRKPQLVSLSLGFLFKTMPCHASQKLILCVSVLHKLPSCALSLSSPPLLLTFHHTAVGLKLYYHVHWSCFWEDWLCKPLSLLPEPVWFLRYCLFFTSTSHYNLKPWEAPWRSVYTSIISDDF